jgi:hypothetical protein
MAVLVLSVMGEVSFSPAPQPNEFGSCPMNVSHLPTLARPP